MLLLEVGEELQCRTTTKDNEVTLRRYVCTEDKEGKAKLLTRMAHGKQMRALKKVRLMVC